MNRNISVEETIKELYKIAENYQEYKKLQYDDFEIKLTSDDLAKIFAGDKDVYNKHTEKVTLTLQYEYHYVGSAMYERKQFKSLKEFTEKIINILEKTREKQWLSNDWEIDLEQLEDNAYEEYDNWLVDVYLQKDDAGGIDICSYNLEQNVYNVPEELTFCMKKIKDLMQEITYTDF